MYGILLLEFRRLRAICGFMIALSLALFLCRSVQGTILRQWPSWIPKSDWTFSTVYSYERAGDRLAGVARATHSANARFAATLGSSPLEAAVDPTTWDAATAPLRWVHLSGNAVNGNGLEGMGRILLGSRLKPQALVIGLNPGVLAQADDYTDSFMDDDDRLDLSTMRNHIKTKQFSLLKDDVEHLVLAPLNKVFPNRNRVGMAARYLALEGRLALFTAMGVPTEIHFTPESNPWVVTRYDEQHSTDYRKTQFYNHGRRGWYEPRYYSTSRPGFVALVGLVRRARQAHVPVMVVLLPEKREVRSAVPPEAVGTLKAALVQNFASDPPPLIDLRDLISDDYFSDVVHLNSKGSLIFSQRMGRELETWLKREAN
jgi:hypothetical protein